MTTRTELLKTLLIVAVIGALCVPGAWTQTERAPLRFGMSTALTGPAENLGQEMRLGVELCFAEVNESGGIGGRPLDLIALDDGYEPSRTVPNMHRLIDDEQVIAIIGNVGTPTAIAAVPIVNEAHVPLFGAFTGAGVLRRDPPDRYVINWRASYAEETAEMVGALVGSLGIGLDEIAFFTQRDGYGDTGYNGGVAAMREHGYQADALPLNARYTRNTLNVEEALAQLIDAPVEPRAVIMVGSYGPCAKLIRLAHAMDFNPIFLNLSFVGSQSLAEQLGEDGEGVIITQVVPHIRSDLPIVRDYHHALETYGGDSEPSFVSLEGYIVARMLIEGLRRIEGEITRENLVDALEEIQEADIGVGFPVSLSREEHQASHRVWPTVISGGEIVALEWQNLANVETENE